MDIKTRNDRDNKSDRREQPDQVDPLQKRTKPAHIHQIDCTHKTDPVDATDKTSNADEIERAASPGSGKQGTVVIFRIQLLPPSETFIVSQAAALRRFAPFFVGWRKIAGLDLPQDKTWTVDHGGVPGRLRELRFRYVGPTRQEVARLRARKPRLLYAHFAPDAYAAMRLAERLDVPLVTALHGYDVTMSDESLARTRLGREYLRGRAALQKKGALFLACSSFIRDRGLALGFPPERTIVHSIGVDIDRFEPRQDRPREKTILFVGRLVEKKGCGSLIEAMAVVQRSCPGAELVVIGDGPFRMKYETQAAARGVRCRFFGSQPPGVVRDWMARAAIFCVPSVVAATGDAEGFGMVFIEAQAMGLPVVSTRSGGIPEAVKHEQTGLLVEEHDSPALARAILRLLEDSDLWHRYSVSGRRRVVRHFNLAHQTSRLENLFEELLGRR